MNLVCGVIVKNEADRYLKRVIENNLQICNKIIILDDNSSDNTIDICRSYGDKISVFKAINSWDNEWLLRDELLQYMLKERSDYVWICDADEIYCESFIEESKIIMSKNIPIVSFYFYDMWNSENKYRSDKYFGVGTGVRMCRSDLLKDYKWNKNKRHCGSLPFSILGNTPTYIATTKVKHLGYLKEEDRIRKYKEKTEDDKNNEFYSKEVYQEILNNSPPLYNFI